MGIRYYAYAFDSDQTDLAVANPRNFIGSDPLADAWGLVPHAQLSPLAGVPRQSKDDLLYLDKAWWELQGLAAPRSPRAKARPAYRMLEGRVTMTSSGWIPWTRTITPDEVPAIAADLVELDRLAQRGGASEYQLEYLSDAIRFTAHQASVGRGFAYQIG